MIALLTGLVAATAGLYLAEREVRLAATPRRRRIAMTMGVVASFVVGLSASAIVAVAVTHPVGVYLVTLAATTAGLAAARWATTNASTVRRREAARVASRALTLLTHVVLAVGIVAVCLYLVDRVLS